MSTSGAAGASSPSDATDSDSMKRAAVKNLIERYFRQLTEGCGNPSCGNANCFSSGRIQPMTRDQAAAAALQLFKCKGSLCATDEAVSSPDHHAFKIPRSTPPSAAPPTAGGGDGNGVEGPSTLASSSFGSSATSSTAASTTASSMASTSWSDEASGRSNVITVAATSQHQMAHTVETGSSSTRQKSTTSGAKSKKASTTTSSGASSESSSQSTTASTSFPKKQIATLNEDKFMNILQTCKAADNYSLLIRTLGETFNNPESLMGSFRKRITVDHMSKEDRSALEDDKDKDTDDSVAMETDEPAGETLASGVAAATASSTAASMGAAASSGLSTSSGANLELMAAAESAKFSDDELSLDLLSLRRCYKALFEDNKDIPCIAALVSALFLLAGDVEMDMRYRMAYQRDKNYLNIFVIVFELPCLHSPEFLESALPKFLKATGYLPLEGQAKLCRYWSKYEPKRLQTILETMQQLITVRIITGSFALDSSAHSVNDDDGITGATKVMKLIYYASLYGGERDTAKTIEEEKELSTADGSALLQDLFGAIDSSSKRESDSYEDPLAKSLGVRVMDSYKPLLDHDLFINESVNEKLEMDKDYMNFKQRDSHPEKFSFLINSFILTSVTKNLGLYFSNKIRMINERRTSLYQSVVYGEPTTLYLKVRVRRSHLIDDALVGLEMVAMENPAELKKQLYVEFEGEQGIDEGGVSKEFFQLVVEEIFNPDFGMFVYNEDTRQFWFNSTCFESDAQFTLIGIVLGLAIYNNIILDIHFPMVVYRKLLGKRGNLRDLEDSHPVLFRSLTDLLEYKGDDIEDVFMLTFRISYQDVFGTNLNHDLVENGDSVPVNQENKRKFVDLYADFLLNKSVDKQFKAFHRGFLMVTNESPLNMLFRPDEVELLVCGSKVFNWSSLEEATDYDGGYSKDSETIRIFWDVIQNDFDEQQKRLFLQFTTGSDRVPIGGLGKLKVVIARNGSDLDRLPTSHTCFNVLLLPDYKDKEKLKDRLTKAISYAKGFGML